MQVAARNPSRLGDPPGGLVAAGILAALVCAAACASSRASAGQVTAADEASVMTGIREQLARAPGAALARIEEAERTFGESRFAEERRALAITALIDLDRIGEARSRAYRFLARYPDGPYAAHVQAMTGVHPMPKGPTRAPVSP